MERVVVTGLGVVSPIGIGKEDFFNALRLGISGIKRISLFDASSHSVQIAGEVKNFNPEDYIEKKETRRFDRVQQFALAATQLAISDAGIDFTKENTERVGVFVTSGIGGISSLEEQAIQFMQKGPSRVSPFLVTQLIIDAIPGYISIRYGLKGETHASVAACASSTKVLGEAYLAIKNGFLDTVIAGGAEAAITPLGVASFASMRALSTKNDIPEKASRPFDKNRDGFVMGEGSGILILESLSHALERKAKIYAEIAGYGTTADGYHITAPDPTASQIVRSMLLSIESSGVALDQVDYINAHGTSTPLNDKNETAAIKKLFGERAYKIPVSSTKSMIGHTLGAAGALESIATVLTIEKEIIFPTINYEEKDPECDLDYVPNYSRETRVNAAIKNSFGFGGHNVSLLFKKFVE